MKIKRIIASDMREAMRQVRRVFGDEAVILSNKPVAGGGERPAERSGRTERPASEAPAQPTRPATRAESERDEL